MKYKRNQVSDRRGEKGAPGIPFKDSDGAIIRECRRRIPDRRIGSIEAEWIDEVVILISDLKSRNNQR